MKKNFNNFIINKNQKILDAIKLISINKNRAVLVEDNQAICGVVSEGDIIKALLQNKSLHSPISNIMNKSFKYLTEYNLNNAINFFKKFGITIVPILNSNMKLKDIIKLSDILKNYISKEHKSLILYAI